MPRAQVPARRTPLRSTSSLASPRASPRRFTLAPPSTSTFHPTWRIRKTPLTKSRRAPAHPGATQHCLGRHFKATCLRPKELGLSRPLLRLTAQARDRRTHSHSTSSSSSLSRPKRSTSAPPSTSTSRNTCRTRRTPLRRSRRTPAHPGATMRCLGRKCRAACHRPSRPPRSP